MDKEPKLPFCKQLDIAMDGRTNMWLHKKTKIAQSELSRIRTGRLLPSKDQFERINAIFNNTLTIND